MSEQLIKPYEISVWENELTLNGEFIEHKLAVIGSDTMTGLNKVYDPVFNKKSNGEKTLTFSLKYKYFDPYSGNEGVVNPFAALLINERKVKLHYDDKWYEFIIKEHSESSDGYEWTYTCVDAFVLELSKIGYNITFDNELNNNQGTAYELAKETLKNTDWRVGTDDVGIQFVAEPVYQATLYSKSDITIINVNDDGTEEPSAGDSIYIFYSYVKNKSGKFVQFIIADDNRQYTIDDKNVITDTNFRITTDLVYDERIPSGGSQTVKGFWLKSGNNYSLKISLGDIETRYHVNRIAYNQRTAYDPIMERTVSRYKAGDREIYKYVDDVYTTSNVVTNFFTNGDNFNALEDGSLQGWNQYVGDSAHAVNKIELVTYPELSKGSIVVQLESLSEIEGYLKHKFAGVRATNTSGYYYNVLYNGGFNDNVSEIGSISKGEKFVFRWRTKAGHVTASQNVYEREAAKCLRVFVAKYVQETPNPYTNYYKRVRPTDIILDFNQPKTFTPTKSQNIVEGGYVENNTYKIDGVSQTVSTKYLYRDEGDRDNNNVGKLKAWNPNTKKFVLYNNDDSKYLPYYYLVATATKSVSNSVLTDPTQKYGLFVYTVYGGAVTYYIQDIQLTRFVADESDPSGNTPVLIGNAPTATVKSNEYYYIKPIGGAQKEDIITYASAAALKEATGITEDVEPVYNENSEKVLSISESQSNCFNILQSIAETFECWIDLEVEHDENGYITYDSSGLPNKYVNLKQYAGEDNWAGFKYGINLQSIQREVNSEEIVTKLIVDQSQSDYVDEGYISIANAKSNISGDSYILNFDYFYNQGLLDRIAVEPDRLDFITQLSELNIKLKDAQERQRTYTAALTSLGSNRNTYTEMVDTALDLKNEALSIFEEAAGMKYENYVKKQGSLSANDILTNDENILDTIGQLYVNSSIINNYSGVLSNVDKEYKAIRKKLYGIENYNIKIWSELDINNQRHIYVELNDYLDGFSFTLSGSTYNVTLSKKYFDITYTSSVSPITISFSAPTGYSVKNGNTTITSYNVNTQATARFKIQTANAVEGIIDEIEHLLEDKTALIKAFENKYSGYIQEGSWSSTDYIDAELYYLDALQVSNTSSQPAVTYTIDVVEISQLEGFEWYNFEVGDKTYIEDTEFFGWHQDNIGTELNPEYVLTPAREEVIVSEVEWHLDEPDKNTITVQNYKTQFEDLFQRISASVQTVQYNEATYAKISSLLDANGTINQNVLIESLNNLSGKEYNLTSNGSIIVEEDAILVRNLTNPTNRVIINSEGIRVSSDGGNTWTTAIDGQGINVGIVYTGSLNTNEIIIGSADSPSFRWDKSGISAYHIETVNVPADYRLTSDTEVVSGKTYYIITYQEEYNAVTSPEGDPSEQQYYEYVNGNYELSLDTEVVSGKTYYVVSVLQGYEAVDSPTGNPNEQWYYEYVSSTTSNFTDLKNFVRFDEYGFYGIKSSAFKAQSLEDILDEAHFAVTWNGFFIRNSYEGGGKVEITSDNDFRVLNTVNNELNEKIKIGALEWMVPADANSFSSEKTYYTENEGVYVEVENPTISEIDSYYEKEFEPQKGIEPSLYGIRIKNDTGATVMQTDDDGNLEITGTIYAEAGQIGGMTVDDDKLSMDTIVLEPGVGIYSTILTSQNEPVFTISDINGAATFNGITARGHIEAQTGTLGLLTVQDVITVGDNNHTGVIKSNNYLANQSGWRIDSYGIAEFQNAIVRGEINATSGVFSGNVQVGTSSPYISINGQQASIYSSNYQDGAGRGWMINKDGDAVFNNITARGAIKTAVFEYAEIQAVGGVFIFRPSSTIRDAEVSGNNLVLTVDKPQLFKDGQWCKVSNYASGNNDPDVIDPQTQTILQNNGLTHVYQVSRTQGSNNITLIGAAAMVEGQGAVVEYVTDLIGGALVDMGNKVGTSNYGIGINSSDNTVNLPARAISLFETAIDETQEPKVTYSYRGILGTLPVMNSGVNASIYQYMQGTQGIYTDNMYIGDATQFISFYTDKSDPLNPEKKLRIKANQVVFENPNSPTGWSDVSEATDPTQGGHFIYTTSVGTTPAGAGIIQNYSDNPTQWGYNTWISTRGIDLRHGEESYATLNTNGLILNKGGIESGEPGTNDFVYLSTNDYPREEYEYVLIDTSQYESEDPSEEGWYELINDEYQLTTDTTIVNNKDYYTYELVEEGLTINGHTPSEENNDAAWREIIGQNFGVDAAGALYAYAGQIGDAIINGGKLILGDGSVGEAQLNIGKYITFGYGYSLITDPAYIITEDTEVVAGKTYYQLVSDEYIEVTEPIGNPHENNYYEFVQPPNWPGNYYKPVEDGRIDEYEKVPPNTIYEPNKYYIKDENRPQLIIGNKGIVAVTIDITSENGQMTFWQDWKPVAYINNNRMTIPESVMLNEMKVGEKLWSWKHHDGNLCLKWLGD